MKHFPTPTWPENVEEAIAIQQALRREVRLENDDAPRELIAGIDCSYDIASNRSFAFIVLIKRGERVPLATAHAELPTPFPYIPGLLSFREIPVILEALRQLPFMPDLLMVDGQGVAHPRRLGIAAHLGVITDMPALGVAKSKLVGTFAPLGEERGAYRPLMHRGERIGTVMRSKENCLPLFISPGHRLDHETALRITLDCLAGYRLPEPTRLADKISKTQKPIQAEPLLL